MTRIGGIHIGIPTMSIKQGLESQVTDMAHIAAAGRNVMPAIALAVAKAAHTGKLNEDDAAELYEMYIKEAGYGPIPERTSPTFKVQVSKLRQVIKLAKTHDAPAIVQTAIDLHRNTMRHGKYDGRLKSGYSFIIDVAREQMRSTRALTERAMRDLLFK